MICLEEFAGRVVQDFVHQPLQKKFEVRFYVCVDVEMLIRHSLKNLIERDRDSHDYHHQHHQVYDHSGCAYLVVCVDGPSVCDRSRSSRHDTPDLLWIPFLFFRKIFLYRLAHPAVSAASGEPCGSGCRFGVFEPRGSPKDAETAGYARRRNGWKNKVVGKFI